MRADRMVIIFTNVYMSNNFDCGFILENLLRTIATKND